MDEIQVDDKLNFIEEPVEIMDREVKRLKQSRIPIVKVRWNSKRGPEFTWERKDQMQKKYPHLFTNSAPAAEVKDEPEVDVSNLTGKQRKLMGNRENDRGNGRVEADANKKSDLIQLKDYCVHKATLQRQQQDAKSARLVPNTSLDS
ncbi:hypothetical protein Tco_1172685 [Tanacetum coccineum]